MAYLIDNLPPPQEPTVVADLTIRSSGAIGEGGTYFWTRMENSQNIPVVFTGKPGDILIVDRKTGNTNPVYKSMRISFV